MPIDTKLAKARTDFLRQRAEKKFVKDNRGERRTLRKRLKKAERRYGRRLCRGGSDE